jgi:predicted ATPase/class 3 adenylate cyclase/DNA-binding CsgD family transcriptional regulator
MAAQLPTGTVTFLFTDVEGSTRLWEQHPEAMREAMGRHDAIVESLTEQHGGRVVRPRGEGDSRFCVFARATDAVAAASAIQRELQAERGPTPTPKVRMALHTGEADLREGDYYGPAVNRCARLRAIAHGGQTLLSRATHDLVQDGRPPGVTLRDLGEHRLLDLQRPEQVFELIRRDQADVFPPVRSLDRLPNNLPVQLTSFVGRTAEMAEVRRLLGETRLLTLSGTGGAGKTRLALQAAAELVDAYPDGVWQVDLAPLSDAALVPQTVASTLGLREVPGQPLLGMLVDRLRGLTLLLLLDNCEHLIDPCARLAEALLRGCPRLRILATSREPLGIAGERIWPVPPMTLPGDEAASAEGLAESEAVRLFAERAQAVLPTFAVTPQNALAVAALCRRLDGMPLAIELGAARVRVLTVEQIVARLDERVPSGRGPGQTAGAGRFGLLTAGSRTAMPRQQTLRALVDWSYDLLSDREQVVFNRLGVFAGGWTLEAAEAVCADGEVGGEEVLDLLARLVDKSLVVGEAGGDGTGRHRLLETLREYARERLAATGDESAARERHAAFFLALAERAEPLLEENEMAAWLGRLEREHDNLRAALRFLLEQGDAARGLRLGAALRHFWHLGGHYREAGQRLAELLALPGAQEPTRERARALDAAGFLARFAGDLPRARALIEAGLAVQRRLGDKKGVADALSNLGAVTLFQQDLATARRLYEESLATNRALGNRQGIADALSHLGRIAAQRGELEAAREMHADSLTLWRELGDGQGVGWAQHKLGDVALRLGDLARARELFVASLLTRRDLAHRWGIAESLEGLVGLAVAERQLERALRLGGAAAALCEAIGVHRDPVREGELAGWVESARRGLPEATAAAAWEAGRAMRLDQAVAGALAPADEPAPASAADLPLTAREREVVSLIARGRTNRQIADALVISERTAERHVANVMDKLDLTARSQIAVWAHERGLR